MHYESCTTEDDLTSLTQPTVKAQPGLMKLPADEIVDSLLRDNPPGHVGSIIRYLQFYINRSGKKINPERKEEAERAKRIFQGIHSKKKIVI